jgi:hypothetical protein
MPDQVYFAEVSLSKKLEFLKISHMVLFRWKAGLLWFWRQKMDEIVEFMCIYLYLIIVNDKWCGKVGHFF